MQINLATQEDLEELRQLVQAQGKELARLQRLQKQWVDTAYIEEHFSISRSTLENLRTQKKIEFKYIGAKNTKPVYSLASIQDYYETKPGRLRVNKEAA